MALDTGLQPVPNYLAAMQSGASLGLNLRKQDTAESETADNLKLAYAHLSATQEAAKQRASQMAAANALRAAHEQALLEHYTEMEQARQNAAEAAAKRGPGNASIVEHPEVPGMQFLRNPSGSETPVVRPAKDLTDAQKFDLQIKAENLGKLGPSELPTDQSYQSRTNLAGEILRKYPVGKSPSGTSDEVAKRAHAAISAGADPKAVKERYKKLTGQDLE